MVVWEDGRMKKSDYRKFIIRTVVGNDDFASMREVVTRRYARLQEEKTPMPGLVLIDGGLGQLHAAAEALEAIGIIDQPLASIAKREEIIYVYGQEDEPMVLDRFSPILHLIQIDSRRSAPLRRHLPPLAAQHAAAHQRARRDSGCRQEDSPEAAEGIRQPGAGARRHGDGTGDCGGPGGRPAGEASLPFRVPETPSPAS